MAGGREERMGQDEIRSLIETWGCLWGVADLWERVTVSVGTRLKRTLGVCEPARGRVRLNAVLFREENRGLLVETLCHEAAHAAAHHLHGRRVRPHGAQWRALVGAAGFVPRARIPADEIHGRDPARKPAPYLYRHVCRDCRAVHLARRTDHRWRCRACRTQGRDGRFEVTRQQAR
jgi:SprT protein